MTGVGKGSTGVDVGGGVTPTGQTTKPPTIATHRRLGVETGLGIPEEVDDRIPFAEKMGKLESDLKQHFAESEKLEKELLENLKKIKT